MVPCFCFVRREKLALDLVPCREMLDPCGLGWGITPCPGLQGGHQAKVAIGSSGPPSPTVGS